MPTLQAMQLLATCCPLVAQTYRHHVCASADVHMHLHLQAPFFTGQAAQADNCHNHKLALCMTSFTFWHCLRLLQLFATTYRILQQSTLLRVLCASIQLLKSSPSQPLVTLLFVPLGSAASCSTCSSLWASLLQISRRSLLKLLAQGISYRWI